MSITDNIMRIREEIADIAAGMGRNPSDIRLVAASKTRSSDEIRQATAAGVDAVGENRVQEMLIKNAEGAYNSAPLHFIGSLQSNKVRQIVGVCDLIESVDSPALVELIGKRAEAQNIVQDVLIEVNIGKEPQKAGVLPELLPEIVELASRTEGIRVLGLMAIPPIFDKNERTCNYFDAMYQLFVDIRGKKYDNNHVRFLSMGMSDSYADAIRAGSNMVRIGSAIFGER
ncbi:MAG: YggS family pyridoxal phosphate-dependent enzyme [Oscillospiraceae bacterium]|nr:YggS family pyridoxal phosphate-dependent enzyme [Oscillospiraceae bacterium]